MTQLTSDLAVHDVTVDVTDAVDLPGPLHTAVTVFASRAQPKEGAVVAFGFPGGGYNRQYFDLDLPIDGNFSEARWHAARGWIYVACDHLAVGGSTKPADLGTLTFETVAAANDATVRTVVARLEQGTLVDGLAPIPVATRLGFGQSMGGCLTIVAQGHHGTFDGIGILGYSAIHTVMPQQGGEPSRQLEPERGTQIAGLEDSTAVLADSFAYAFHWPDVPTAVVEHDLSTFPLRQGPDVPAWGRDATPPPMAVTMLSPGAVRDEAAVIEVPVLVVAGERDVVPDPRAEPSAYRSSLDLTVLVVPRMAHMHNFAGTREVFWRNAHAWGDRVASRC
jgi:pimeloyl-ACP methyl ester carboxylesterase